MSVQFTKTEFEFTPLEALNDIQQTLSFTEQDTKEDKERIYQDLDIIETALKDGEKYKTVYSLMKAKLDKVSDEKLKLQNVLEIIVEKRVNIDLFMIVKDVDIYNGFACNSGEGRKLTQEEFDFLKEVLI